MGEPTKLEYGERGTPEYYDVRNPLYCGPITGG
jgi:hypothetical protein